MLFMVAADEDVLDVSLVVALGEQAVWIDDPGYGQPARSHRRLHDALQAGGRVQAFLRLVDDGTSVGPIVQYLAPRVWSHDGWQQLRAGRLAFKWFPDQEPAWIAERFQALTRVAWQQLLGCTRPRVADMWDQPMRRARIGVHAMAWLAADPNRRLADRSGFAQYQLRPARSPTGRGQVGARGGG
jgi:hypothetical protein